MICTGQFSNAGKPRERKAGTGAMASARKGNEIATELSKAEVCIHIGVNLLIDDSLENALACANYISLDGMTIPPPVLLFGSYASFAY
jgi:hypothetical protein